MHVYVFLSPLPPSVCGVVPCAGTDGHPDHSIDTVAPPAVLRRKRQSSSSTFFLELYVATDTAAVSSACLKLMQASHDCRMIHLFDT